ncbi:hypothetical protein [Streptomyces sp. R33]|uniref:Uncharacterized protein n=1 Tax=Streptomyces sp. R33 TaxID=3238629 RepID=A0AB39XUN9_9ACTN
MNGLSADWPLLSLVTTVMVSVALPQKPWGAPMAVISPRLLLSVATTAALARSMLGSETLTQYTPA